MLKLDQNGQPCPRNRCSTGRRQGEGLPGGHAWPVVGGRSVCGPAEPTGGNKTNPWRLVGNQTGSLLSQCYIHQLSLQLHHGIEALGDAECPNAYIQINVNPLSR